MSEFDETELPGLKLHFMIDDYEELVKTITEREDSERNDNPRENKDDAD